MKMNKDISTVYTKYKNKNCGRKGYFRFKEEKEDVISPKEYGIFIQERKRRRTSI